MLHYYLDSIEGMKLLEFAGILGLAIVPHDVTVLLDVILKLNSIDWKQMSWSHTCQFSTVIDAVFFFCHYYWLESLT